MLLFVWGIIPSIPNNPFSRKGHPRVQNPCYIPLISINHTSWLAGILMHLVKMVRCTVTILVYLGSAHPVINCRTNVLITAHLYRLVVMKFIMITTVSKKTTVVSCKGKLIPSKKGKLSNGKIQWETDPSSTTLVV